MKWVHVVHHHIYDGSDDNDPSDLSNSYYAFSNEDKAIEFHERMAKVLDHNPTFIFSMKIDDPKSWQELEDHEAEFKDG